MVKFLLVITTLSFISCSTAIKQPTASSIAVANITKEAAELRFAQIKNVKYKLDLDLTSPEKLFGVESINFEWKGSRENLRIDFYKGEVTELKVNGKPTPYTYDGVAIAIAPAAFNTGANSIHIQYSRTYNSEGRGLTRFEDPVDKRVYLFTQFEPYYANYMFPSFDQPDLKATYTLSVKAPKEWEVVTSVMETKKNNIDAKINHWEFPESALFSTYLFSLHAGPYKVWKNDFKFPLRLFARQSISQYVDHKSWFDVTRKGLDFFGKYFDYPYPFKKLDQVIHPIMGGAMENVAAITYGEWSVPRGKATYEVKRGTASTILHEIAHMWFGDLVTMKWWNDLWLNESFATFLAYTALMETTPYQDTWLSVNTAKVSVMQADQMVTTHPIEGPVRDALEANSVFDKITYGKGASVLKQLDFYLGAEIFRKGVASYIKAHQWRNTTRQDFVSSLSKISGKDLSRWQEVWLTTANLNTLSTNWECQSGKISKFEVIQTSPPSHPVVRPHAFEIALLKLKNNKVESTHTQKLESTGEITTGDKLIGLACPDAVFPNGADYGYFKVKFDEKSLAFFKANVSTVQNSFIRKLVWSTLWKMVEDAQFDFAIYGQMGLKALETEKEREIFSALASELTNQIVRYYHHAQLQESSEYRAFQRSLEKLLEKKLIASSGDIKRVWFDFYVGGARTPEALEQLKLIVIGKRIIKGLELDQDRRWALLARLSSYGFKGVQDLVQVESEKDPSFSGKKERLASTAALPNMENKFNWIEEYKSKPNYSYPELAFVMRRMFPFHQKALHQSYYETFFTDLLKIRNTKETLYQITFASTLAPFECRSDSDLISNFLSKEPNQDPSVLKILREASDESKRCARIVEFNKKQTSQELKR